MPRPSFQFNPRLFLTLCLALSLAVIAATASAGDQRILVQSTTSTQNSGFYDYILPIFKAETGYIVDVVAVGTGQAIRNASNGDADVLLVHATPAEMAFVAAGHGVARFDLMYNDFVLIGPESDPLGLTTAADLDQALALIAGGGSVFISRGDDSGTHKKEQSLWQAAGLGPRFDAWYRESGSGMGATIRMAVETDGYTLTDRATWIAFGGKQQHKILVEGDAAMFNQYGIIAVNPVRHPHVNAKGAQVFIDWMLSDRGQALIADFRVNDQHLFFPNAGR
jgi:tungstate transport system substrate-binding protein